jgi:Carboxypeptidase regulatory-like domain/TonB-dependent Receptor Plug Domain
MFRCLHGRFTQIVQCTVVLTVILCLCSATSFAQVTSGTIFGAVKDQSGAYVAKATVSVNDTATGVSREVTTDDNGGFVVPNLPPGTYTITVSAAGFKKVEKAGVILSAADHLNAGDFVLTVGAVTEQVTVTADIGQLQLQSNSGERSDLITSKQLGNVAMNGRNVLDYMKLVPGVISSFSGAVSGTGGLDSMNINGTRANEHEFTIDGASNVDTGNNGGTHVTINPDAIEEVKILTSNYRAEFGKAAGGQIAIVTKSGTNQWHGDVRFFHRNEGMNANEWFANKNGTPIAKYRYNDIGYQIGGPIKKDKLFVFWSQEFYRQLIPIGGTTQFYTPTKLERQGDFSQSTDGNGKPIVISGPGITNNKIDPTQLSAAQQAVFTQVQKILNLFPLPNVSGFGVGGQNYNFSEALSGNAPRREDILRIDYQINEKNRLFGRWIHNAETDTSPFVPFPGPFGIFACSSSVNFPGGCVQHHPGWNLSLNLVSTITSTLLNEFSVGPSHTLSIAEGTNGNISLANNGITLPLLYPTDTIPDMGFGGLNNVNFGGGYLGATPWKQANTTINVNDNLTWIKGSHALKFGLFYQRNRKDQIAWGNINGQFNFGPGPTGGGTCPGGANTCALGDPLASALLGSFDSFGQSTARPTGYFRYNQLEFFAQDTWKVTRSFTLDYGMRFAWIPPQYDAKNQVALFDPSTYNPATAVQIDSGGNIIPNSGDPLDGMVYTKNGQIPAGGWNSRGIMPEPRLGFAYDPFKDHKTVFRGGVGMMHDRTQGNLIFNTVFNNPALVQTATLPAGNIDTISSTKASFPLSVQADKNIIGASKDGHVPTVYNYSLGIQRVLFSGTTLDVAYVGNVGRHLVTARDINTIPYGYAFTAAAQDPNACGWNGTVGTDPYLLPQYAAAGYSYSGICALGHDSYTNAPLVPYKGYGQIPYLQWDGTSNYNSLQVSLQRRFSKGLTFGAVYTWSKALTTADADEDWQNPFSPRILDYRAAGWDRTHVFAANYVYNLPNATKHFGGPKWLSYITDDYQLSGVVQFMTGTPVNLNDGWSMEGGALDGSNMWGINPYYYTLDKNQNPIFPVIGPDIRGSRDLLRNGGMQDWDTSIFKNIPLREKYSIQLLLETYNTFNHPNFNDKNYGFNVNGPWQWQPGTPFSISKSSNWGTYADTYGGVGGPRVVQLAAKFIF